MSIKRNIKFNLNARKGKTDNIPIRLRVTYNCKRFDFPIGYNINLNKWDSKSEKALGSSSETTVINKVISEIRDRANKLFIRYELDDITPTPEQVNSDLSVLFSKKKNIVSEGDEIKEITLLDRFDEFTKDVGKANNWTDGTYEKFRSVRKHIADFNAELKVDDFDSETIGNYLNFLQEVKLMRNTTIKKQLGFLKWYLRWADAKGYSKQRACFSFIYKPKGRDNKNIIFLDWEELTHLYSLEILSHKQYLERVRDVFCFCCFTSLRYSDVYNLRRSDIKKDVIEITTIKTSDRLLIDLNDYSRAILKKYKDIPYQDDKALPVISNQKMNDYLKELGELAGFNEPIRQVYFIGNERKEEVLPKYALLGTHAGRRTFICNALALGVPAQVVMKWTGHSDYKAMKPYIDIAERTRKEAMSVFNR